MVLYHAARGAMGETKNVAAACIRLASPTRDYATRTCLAVDGG